MNTYLGKYLICSEFDALIENMIKQGEKSEKQNFQNYLKEGEATYVDEFIKENSTAMTGVDRGGCGVTVRQHPQLRSQWQEQKEETS